MKILDAKGRLFGKFNILDVGAAFVILLVVVGIFFFPGTTGSIAQINSTKNIEIDLVVRGLSVRNPQVILGEFSRAKKLNVIIRNQPHASLDIKSFEQLQRNIIVPQPDGSAKVLPDPRTDTFSMDMLLTLAGKAEVTDTGAVIGGSKVKIGMPIELEGNNYNFNATIIDIRQSSS